MLRTVAITLDQPRALKYDLNAFALLRERHGINLFKPDPERLEDPVAVRAMLWAGLVHEDPSLTVEQVGSWVDLSNVRQISDKVADAMLHAQTREVNAVNPQPPFGGTPTSTGGNSTSSDSAG